MNRFTFLARVGSALIAFVAFGGLAASAGPKIAPAMWPEAHFDRAAKSYYEVKLNACRAANIQSSLLTLTEEVDWMDDYLGQVSSLLQAARAAPTADPKTAEERGQLSVWLPVWQRERAEMWRWLVELDHKPKCPELTPPPPSAPAVKPATQISSAAVAMG